ncbi:hypothetical protein [Komagataeibacter xylinus]|uniref:hypothetical protein n=1 Tax=Komagataeibacter xylinus TaxID=28448 RepID=UPI00280B268B|nr:hypothetical protein [Komagataeibacter xylinus]
MAVSSKLKQRHISMIALGGAIGGGLHICSFYLCSLLLILLVTPWKDVMPGHFPFLTTLARIGVPHTVMIMQCVVLVAFSSILSPGGVFSFLLNCSGAVVLVVYVMISTAHYTLFRATAGRQALGHVLRTALVIAFSVVTFIAMFSRADQRATVVFCFLTVLFFLAIYAIRKQLSCRRADVQLRGEQRIGS